MAETTTRDYAFHETEGDTVRDLPALDPALTFDFSDDFTMTENGADALDYVVDPPSISATNENGVGSLVARVFAAWGQASATVSLLSNRYQRQWPGAIAALNDHKGALMGAWERLGEPAGSHALA
ncbi:hypothetical protein [Hephaestia mangrovi]|uniref:hypothetical protein n=1 Tax=Hephaestia mangrovi TaxID=2873268 RepID=UPI001CA6254C|nr:hypothetical protein [Hephaestia mangrovi]MBY8828893.1 hypothetical protein [Hephaestia mangrovi]